LYDLIFMCCKKDKSVKVWPYDSGLVAVVCDHLRSLRVFYSCKFCCDEY
jgi:hypothetical protein